LATFAIHGIDEYGYGGPVVEERTEIHTVYGVAENMGGVGRVEDEERLSSHARSLLRVCLGSAKHFVSASSSTSLVSRLT
jgi:hypothetical protein